MDHFKDPRTDDCLLVFCIILQEVQLGLSLGDIPGEYSQTILHVLGQKWTLWRTWELGTKVGQLVLVVNF